MTLFCGLEVGIRKCIPEGEGGSSGLLTCNVLVGLQSGPEQRCKAQHSLFISLILIRQSSNDVIFDN